VSVVACRRRKPLRVVRQLLIENTLLSKHAATLTAKRLRDSPESAYPGRHLRVMSSTIPLELLSMAAAMD